VTAAAAAETDASDVSDGDAVG